MTQPATSPPVTVPYIPDNAPFSPAQRAWLNGFLAGIFSGQHASAPAPEPAAPQLRVPVLFGSESGNSEALAKQFAKKLKGAGYDSKAIGLDKIQSSDLTKEEQVIIVTSTFGEGDPPANAEAFHQALMSEAQPRLPGLKFAVLALGDTNYEQFCKFGQDLDARLEALGGRRLYERIDCDVDFEEAAEGWLQGLMSVLEAELGEAPAAVASSVEGSEPTEEVVAYSRKHPFPSRLRVNRLLNGEGSAKETRHYELDLSGSGLTYEVGDALGVLPRNCPALVDDLLRVLNDDGETAVPLPDEREAPLRQALLQHYDITKLSTKFLKAVAQRSADVELSRLLEPEQKAALNDYLWGREIIDLLIAYGGLFTPAELVAQLQKLQPRLYSISSSLNAFPDQVHLTVASVRYETQGRKRKGVCSTFLADRAGETVPVFIQASHGFRLPQDEDRPIIMVGPGTGIAPFRAFLHERKAKGSRGRNWLFFGDQHSSTDFLYRDEIKSMQSAGILTRLDLAFSRDQQEKIYVQHRMLEAAPELWRWLEEGAHFYVCGDASRMAKDVDDALHRIVREAGGKSEEEAKAYIEVMKKEKRYARDVY